jgi:antitoxin (DNA-binding transcriptional repressor) of toxin-antitoxin stability system
MTVQVNIYEAKTQLSRLIEQVLAGERVVISKAGKPVVDLVVHAGIPIQYDSLKHLVRYDEDAFNAADAEIAAMWDKDLGVEHDPS